MAKFLQRLLEAEEPMFSTTLARLERMVGGRGIDVRYIADITRRAHAVMRRIGLDPADSTEHELYRALISHVHDKELFAETDDVGLVYEGRVISFNLGDVTENINLSYESRKTIRMQCGVRHELAERYRATQPAGSIIEDCLKDLKLDECELIERHDHKTEKKEATVQQGPSILCIGDIFTDAFITLGDETAKIIKEGGKEWLAVPFGSKPPYEKVDIVKSVGPSPNVAVSAARLGLNASLMAWIGGDETGREAIEYLQEERVDTTPMVTESDKATSYWYVLCYQADRTMLVKSEKYRYEWSDPTTNPDWVYLAYLGEDSWTLHEALLDYLNRNPEVNFALQPGTFQFKWGTEKMAPFYARSRIVMMNREEAMEVTGLPYDSIASLARGLHDLGPEIVVITDGANGSYASHGGRVLTIPNYPDPVPPKERTGAGDAFSSTFVAAIASGESIETALAWSPINSMNVVQHIGAQKGLLSLDEIKDYLASAPDYYVVKELSE